MTPEDLKEIAAQLRTPIGENGVKVGKSMNEKNLAMTMSAIRHLALNNGDQVLELGHGNGGHIRHIMNKADNIHYTGLEVSEEMKKQATEMNRLYWMNEMVNFHLYNGADIPFEADRFNHILTVNTLYFWEIPAQLLKNIYNVLKPGGTFCISFADKSFMETLPFTQYGFELYDLERFKALVKQTNFNLQLVECETDEILSKVEEPITRVYYTAILRK